MTNTYSGQSHARKIEYTHVHRASDRNFTWG